MPYQILSEYICKKLFLKYTDNKHQIIKINKNNLEIPEFIRNSKDKFVCKVDQNIKHRFKQNLIILNKTIDECLEWIKSIPFDQFIIEPFLKIEKEYYLLIQFEDENDIIYFSEKGGIEFNDISQCKHIQVNPLDSNILFDQLGISDSKLIDVITKLYELFIKYHFTIMEINPLAKLEDGNFYPIDFAVKYDTTSLYKWDPDDIQLLENNSIETNNEIEESIKKLDTTSGSSFKFKLLNPDGSIWLFVAGGGASILFTDAIVNFGYIDELANYGEYSGNPSTKCVYEYASLIFDQMVKSKSINIKLIIGGAISNFTDVEKTFDGIIMAIKERANIFREKKVSIFVRRGGLNYKKALENMSNICHNLNIPCCTFGPETHITNFMKNIFNLKEIKDDINEKPKILPIDILDKINNKLLKKNEILDIYNRNSKIIIMNYQPDVVQRILDFDFISGKEKQSVVGIIYPNKANTFLPVFWGEKEILLPIYNNLNEAFEKNPDIDIVINYYSFRSAFKSTMEIIESKVKCITIIAEGIAERDSRTLKLLAYKNNKIIIGPSTVGSIISGCIRNGNTCGSIGNIIDLELYYPGNISIVTRSGGLLNEMCNIIYRAGGSIKEAISIGGDRYPCSTFLDHILRFENDPDVKLICMLGEVGGILELEVAEAVRKGLIQKPIIAWIMGTSADQFHKDIQFGHAGSFAQNVYETAKFKNYWLKKSGVYVPECFEDISEMLKIIIIEKNIQRNDTFKIKPKALPYDFNELIKNKKIRKHAEFYSSISNDADNELTYNNISVSNLLNNNYIIGKTIGHLLFKLDIPEYLARFLEYIIVLLADHGIAVSSAHNTAVCSRAGQNISSSVASGLLCIHDKHGGAIQAAAKEFYNAKYKLKLSPYEFVEYMKNRNEYIPGIGHLYNNSTTNKDKRLEILMEFIKLEFPNYDLLLYAKEVEKITLKKKDNLILNIDGLIGTAIISSLYYHYKETYVDKLLELDALNSLFIISRTIGLCATYIDQRRLKQGLYRHPTSGIYYIEKCLY